MALQRDERASCVHPRGLPVGGVGLGPCRGRGYRLGAGYRSSVTASFSGLRPMVW